MCGRNIVLWLALCLCLPGAALAEEVVTSWPDGTPKSRHTVNEAGVRHGPAVLYYENGRIYVEETYRNGKRNGVQKTYTEEGRVESLINFSDGVFHGQHKTFDAAGVSALIHGTRP